MSKRKGFTLVELLAVIVILGILSIGAIKGVSTLIEKSRTEQKVHQEKVMKMAAESYLQANKSKMPKAIGETVKIDVKDLKTSNYLKEEIKNSKGETCMENSYVKVYKASKNDYEYDAQLFCGDDAVVEDDTNVKKPVVVPLFTDSSGNKNEEVYKNVSDAYLKITIKGSEDEKVAVDGYTYIIYAKRKGEDNLNEVYNSGTLSGNGKESVVVPPIPLKNYIDITNTTEFKVKVVAINALGGRSEEIIGSGSDSGDSATYHDTNPPKCKEIKGEAEEGQWINKANMTSATATNKSRTISAVCDDGKGSGCIRQEFRRTWPNTEQQDAEYSYMQVQDNAGNLSVENELMDFLVQQKGTCGMSDTQRKQWIKDNKCRVRVNVDTTAPTASIAAYKAGANLAKANNTNILKNAETIANNAKQEVTIISDNYQNLVGGWLNKENYPNGVVYEVVVSDNIHLKSWTWETNAPFIEDRHLDSYDKAYSSSNKDGIATKKFQQKDMSKNDCGTLSETIKFGFTEEGLRKGKLTILDEADNPTIFYIEANIDRTAPPVPEPTKLTIVGGGSYTPGGWINKHIIASVADSFKRDNLSNGGKTTLSGFNEFKYEVIRPGGTKVGSSSQTFTFSDNYQGKNSITFVGCDKAGNCSNKNTSKQVWLDTVAPLCTVTLSNPGVNSKGWQGKGETSTVTAVCSEKNTDPSISSGCTAKNGLKTSYSKTYDKNIITNVAGAVANGEGGDVIDDAGNLTHCAADKTVKIDIEDPDCTKSGDNGSWRNKAVTLKWGCSDKGGSNCDPARSGGSKTYSGKITVDTETIKAYTISDNADNEVTCKAQTRNVYYDGVAPTCTTKPNPDSKSKASTGGVTITYDCNDQKPSSGIKKCPSKQTGQKSTQTGTVTDNVGNSSTCKRTIHSFTEYNYIKKNVPKTCTSGKCCGYYKKTSGKCCGYNTHRGQNCHHCGQSCASTTYCNTAGFGCPRGGSRIGYCPGYTSGATSKCKKTTCNCKVCTWNTTAKTCANACTGAKTCTSSCCGYKCGSQWTGWGEHVKSTGCTGKSQKRYYG